MALLELMGLTFNIFICFNFDLSKNFWFKALILFHSHNIQTISTDFLQEKFYL